MGADLFARGRELQDANLELQRVNAELSAASGELQAQQQAKDQFIATLSHELRNPLASACAALDVLDLDGPDHPARAVLRRQLTAMTRMTDDLLEAARVVTRTLPATCHPLDLRPVVTAAVRDIQSVHPGMAHIRVTVPATPVTLNGDPVRLAQMIVNLLDNAHKHTPPGTPVNVDLTIDGQQAILCVHDDGPGFPHESAASLFDPFVRVRAPGATAHAGLGLGLAVVRGIAELHDGTATATSDSTGATITIRLPLTGAPPAGGRQHTGSAPARPPLRILVVEDSTDLAAMYATLLRHRGDMVTVATTGTGALAAAREPFDLVLCDLALGGDIDGYQIGRRLRHDRTHRDTRLVAVSGFTQDTDRERSRAAGFDAHLAKPLDLADLDRFLAQWTGNWTRPLSPRTGQPPRNTTGP